MITLRDHLVHAIRAWAAIRSPIHAALLDDAIASLCTELDTLRLQTADQAAALETARATITQLQSQVNITAPPAVLAALSDLCAAYRAITGIDGAWDEVVIRAERAIIESRAATPAEP